MAPSDSLAPDDPTLLFTSAGMVQFKPFFTGERVPPRRRMATSQKCLRTGDLDIVGTTAFHHTFFEMLGNFSFGDYFKEDAITWAWEFLTGVLNLPKEKLWVTVYLEDDEAAGIWEHKIGVPRDRIVRLGEKSNYWPSNAPSEGPNGPCGPCSEIFVDFGEDVGCRRPECNPDCDCDRFSEVWNLVFTQFNRGDGGVMTPLPMKNIDTGMGLERIVAVMQGARTNFDTDLFVPIINEAAEITGVKYGEKADVDVALKVIADHARAMTFSISDGIMPSNVGRGYVLRRIIRRAALKGKSLGQENSFLDSLADVVIDIMEGPYPALREHEGHIRRTIRAEEEKFRRTLDVGLVKLEEAIAGKSVLPGMEAFVLYDTYGFPVELTCEIASSRGISVDMDGFNKAMEDQRRRAREGSDVPSEVFAGSLGALADIEKNCPATDFVGYSSRCCDARVVGILQGGKLLDSVSRGDEADVVLDTTSFYAESGGQTSDTGIVSNDSSEFEVVSVARVGSLVIHSGAVKSGSLRAGDAVKACVEPKRRSAVMRNHTATHLLHKALRAVLGDHVVQAGSLVEPERLRFDFTHSAPVSADELKEVERIANEAVLSDYELDIYETSLEQAKSDGAMALFGEKYSGEVRVVKVGGFSMELCGGTHVERTSQIGLIKIIAESSVGAGLRRIEAVTGAGALEYLNERDEILTRTAGVLKAAPKDVPAAVERLLGSLKAAEKELEDLRRKGAAGKAGDLASKAVVYSGVRLIAESLPDGDTDSMSSMADALAKELESLIVVLGAPSGDKAAFVAKVTDDLVKRGFHAGNLVREVAKVAGGGGGGRPDFAQAGGRDAGKIGEAMAAARRIVEEQAAS